MVDDDVARGFMDMPWIRFLGFEPLVSEAGTVVLRLDPKPEHLNQNETVAAPILFALAESAGTGALVTGFLDLVGMTYSVVRHAEMHFVAAARGPVTATGTLPVDEVDRARVEVEAGRPVDVTIPATVVDETGREVARVTMVMAIRTQRSP